jgi:hypothetical protein
MTSSLIINIAYLKIKVVTYFELISSQKERFLTQKVRIIFISELFSELYCFVRGKRGLIGGDIFTRGNSPAPKRSVPPGGVAVYI